MSTDSQPERLLEACTTYHREVALATLDTPPGEARAARIAEAMSQCAESCAAPEIAALQSVLDTAPAVQHSPLHLLRSWALTMHLRHALLPHQRAWQGYQRTMTCRVDDEIIPVFASFAAMAAEARRDRRAAIELAVDAQLATLTDLFEAQHEALYNASHGLGYASLDALWETITGVELSAQEDLATELLQETQSTYADLLQWATHSRLRIPRTQLQRHDILALFTFPDYQQYYQPGFLLPSLQASLLDMGIDPRADGRLTWREHAATWGPPFTATVHIPEEIVISYYQPGGVHNAEAFAQACGRGVLWAYTSSELPLVYRVLADEALAIGHGQLWAHMIAHPLWLRQYARLTVDGDYAPWQRLHRLYRLRRQLGRFLYTRYVYTCDSLAGAAEAYRDIMMEACLVDYLPSYHLVDWDWQYASLAFWRGWSLAHALFEMLGEHFASDWFRNPDCGVWLQQHWQEASRHRVEDVLQHISGGWNTTLFAAALSDEPVR